MTIKSEGEDEITDCIFSPDGQQIVCGLGSGILKIWEVQTGKEVMALRGHRGVVNSCAFSPDGRYIVSASEDKTMRIWDVETGMSVTTLHGHTDDVNDCTFSNDGKKISSASEDKTIILWDVREGTEIKKLIGHSSAVHTCAFSPNDKRIISCGPRSGPGLSKEVRLWDIESGTGIRTLTDSGDAIECQYSPDGRFIGWVEPYGNRARVWDSELQTNLATFKVKGYVYDCAFSRDSRYLTLAGALGRVSIWDIETRAEIARLKGHAGWVNKCAYSADGRHILSADETTVKLWDAQLSVTTSSDMGHIGSVIFLSGSPDGRHLLSVSDESIRIWDCESGQEIDSISTYTDEDKDEIRKCSYSLDGNFIVLASNNTFTVWDAQTFDKTSTLIGHETFAFSPDERYLASPSPDGIIHVWNLRTRIEAMRLIGHKKRVRAIAYSPDGRRILSASDDGTLRLWDIGAGAVSRTRAEFLRQTFRTLLWGTDTGDASRTLPHASSFAFSPDGHLIFAGQSNGFKVWYADTGAVHITSGANTDMIEACDYSPSGQQIVTVSGSTLKTLDAQSGNNLLTFVGHSEDIYSCLFLPDGRRIVTSSLDGTARIFDVDTGNEISRFFARNGLNCITLARAGRFIGSGDLDGTVYLLRIRDAGIGTPVLTLVHLYKIESGQWDNKPTAKCGWCGRRTWAPSSVIDAIQRLGREARLSSDHSPCVNMQAEAWNDPRLLSECSHCHEPLRFNPFIVDNRDRY